MSRPGAFRADSTLQDDYETFYKNYSSTELDENRFCDIDNAEGLQHALQDITSCTNRNFVLDFNDRNAWMGLDLTVDTIMDLVKAGGWPGQPSTRWIDISYPARQKKLLSRLAQHYDFAPRILAMMSSEPVARDASREKSSQFESMVDHALDESTHSGDLEKGYSISNISAVSSSNPARTGNLYELLEEVWHYTTFDQGRNYLCVGYNSIYPTGATPIPYSKLGLESSSPLPHCVRVWTWLILCNDRTIITVNEDLFPHISGSPSLREQAILLRTKQNLINVFRSLSRADDPSSAPITLLPIRKRLSREEEASSDTSREAPGLLFYYLFENWYNSYGLVTRRDSRYGKELQNIRAEMFESPQLSQVDRLDQVGNELGVLKRHYKSYIRIIDRITEHNMLCETDTIGSSQITTRMVEESWDGQSRRNAHQANAEPTSLLGIRPGPAAHVRFERLKDMISLYALSEVKDYLAKKDNLVQMNFQLIAIKESRDVERLTRVSLFIAKATMLLLPISLLTAYFGTNIENQSFTLTSYWASFAGIFVVSYIALIGFGIASGTMESWSILSPVRRMVQRARHKTHDT
ncbi:hypothetical protein KVT40_006331 [Elsinoe batatas]|uniref:Uncharacterized protein n=1 Tax=Elsinoe batatas TaxID=2601811 RepID=A0A8K0L1V4_9PEZI|nr:hypothetical protein KVT40_006331 [Elsinoe batatas]